MNKLALALSVLFLPVLTTYAYANTVAGYDFNQYPATVYQGKKAPLQLTKADGWWLFRTRIRNIHRDGTVGFAGKYMVGIWGCGASCIMGAMVDKSTGKVYDLPHGDGGLAYDACYSSDDEQTDERLQFYPNSRLFITRSCTQEALSGTKAKQAISYEVYAWHEQHKKFEHLNTVAQSKIVSIDYP